MLAFCPGVEKALLYIQDRDPQKKIRKAQQFEPTPISNSLCPSPIAIVSVPILDICVRCKFARPGPVGVSLTLKTLGMTRVSELSPLGLITVTEGRDIAATLAVG
jgi:hypothetical protein